MPARPMPVTAQVRVVFGNDDQVPFSDRDESMASGTEVALAGGITLDRDDDLVVEGDHPATAHTTRAAAITNVPITRATSSADL